MHFLHSSYSINKYARHVSALLSGRTLPTPFMHKCKPEIPFTEKQINLDYPNEKKFQAIGWYKHFLNLGKEAISRGLVLDVIVHGSYGDHSQTPFSDLDITLLIPDDIFLYNKSASRFAKWIRAKLHPFLVKSDPLQHHGAFYLWPDLIDNYNESILPVTAYDNAWSIKGSALTFTAPSYIDAKHARKAYLQTILNLLEPEKNFFRYGITPYSIKRLLSNFMLLPPLYFQSQGASTNKKKGIADILQIATPQTRAAIKMATQFRDKWLPPPKWLGILRTWASGSAVPSGGIDMHMCSLYREREIEQKISTQFIPLLKESCSLYRSI